MTRISATAMTLAALCFIAAFGSWTLARAQVADWEFTGRSASNGPCRAGVPAVSRTTVSTRLMRNDRGVMVLAAGNPTWDNPAGATEVQLKIDQGEFVTLTGYPVGPLVFHVIEDAGLERRLRTARSLVWRFPWGEFRASISGLGAAYDRIGYCVD